MIKQMESRKKVALEIDSHNYHLRVIKVLCPKCKKTTMSIIGGIKTFCPNCNKE